MRGCKILKSFANTSLGSCPERSVVVPSSNPLSAVFPEGFVPLCSPSTILQSMDSNPDTKPVKPCVFQTLVLRPLDGDIVTSEELMMIPHMGLPSHRRWVFDRTFKGRTGGFNISLGSSIADSAILRVHSQCVNHCTLWSQRTLDQRHLDLESMDALLGRDSSDDLRSQIFSNQKLKSHVRHALLTRRFLTDDLLIDESSEKDDCDEKMLFDRVISSGSDHEMRQGLYDFLCNNNKKFSDELDNDNGNDDHPRVFLNCGLKLAHSVAESGILTQMSLTICRIPFSQLIDGCYSCSSQIDSFCDEEHSMQSSDFTEIEQCLIATRNKMRFHLRSLYQIDTDEPHGCFFAVYHLVPQ